MRPGLTLRHMHCEDHSSPGHDTSVQQGSSVAPMKTTVGKSTGHMTDAPYGLQLTLSTRGSAGGFFYLDDGCSLQYLHQKQFLHKNSVQVF